MNAASIPALMTGVTGLSVVRALVDGGTSTEAARAMIGGTVATAVLLALEVPVPEFARGVAVVAFLTALLVHGVWLGDALLGSLSNAGILTKQGIPQ